MTGSSRPASAQSDYDHYTRPYDHVMRIETALSNSAARIYDVATQNIRPDLKGEDTLRPHLIQAVNSINALHRNVVQTWNETDFKKLHVVDRLKIGGEFIGAAKHVLSETERQINNATERDQPKFLEALKAIAAQQARLDRVLDEHRERQHVEVSKSEPKTQPREKTAGDLQFAKRLESAAANARPAEVNSGIYQGTILAVTESLVLQQISPRTAILHQRALLDSPPNAGQSASIRYSNGAGVVKAMRELAPARELAR